jgi:hypothetical protein
MKWIFMAFIVASVLSYVLVIVDIYKRPQKGKGLVSPIWLMLVSFLPILGSILYLTIKKT